MAKRTAKRKPKAKKAVEAETPEAKLEPVAVEVEDSAEVVGLPDEVVEQKPAEEPTIETESKSVSIPFALVKFGYEPRRVDIQAMSGKQRGSLRRMTNGLIAMGAKLENGRNVNKPQDAIKWMLEAVAE